MAERRTNRRAFLRGQAAAEAMEAWADKALPPGAAGLSSSAAGYVLHISRRAMACEFQIYLNAGQHAQATELGIEALDLVERLEDQLSVYRPHSELSRINEQAAIEPVEVEGRLFALLEQAVALWRETDGAFDITSMGLSKAWGFFRRQGQFPGAADIQQALERVGCQHVRLDAQRRSVTFDRPGMELNLGSIGKGYALDRCAAVLEAGGVNNFVIHGGHSSIRARGSQSGRGQQDPGWLVTLRHPLRHDRPLADILLRDQSLGTSGSAHQYFHFRGRRYGHVLDPRTGWPVEGVLSATVLAPTAAEADALATALYVLGWERAAQYCRRRPGLALLMVTPAMRAGDIELRTVGLEQRGDTWVATEVPPSGEED